MRKQSVSIKIWARIHRSGRALESTPCSAAELPDAFAAHGGAERDLLYTHNSLGFLQLFWVCVERRLAHQCTIPVTSYSLLEKKSCASRYSNHVLGIPRVTLEDAHSINKVFAFLPRPPIASGQMRGCASAT